jgi:glycosyltransferase involved in cell wall biosynthesis
VADTEGQTRFLEARPRVALISSGLGFVTRGIETWMTELARHLPVSLNVELWSGGRPPDIPHRQTRTLLAVSRDSMAQCAFNWHRRYLNEQLSCLPRALLLLRRERTALAYCGDPALAWHLKGTQRLHGARVVFMNGMRLAPNWAKHFDAVQLIAPAYLEEAKRALGEANTGQFFVSPHFVDTEEFRPASADERESARAELELPEDAFVVLNVGPVGTVSGKRLEWLAREVAAGGSKAVLLSVGGDEEGADMIHTLAREALGARFRPLGPQPRDRMKTFYHAADAYALAALEEPFSIAVLEAMSCGLPVVHHPFEVTSWITGPAGVAVSMTEQGAAAGGLKRLQTDRSWRSERGAQGREAAVQRFSAPVVSAQLALELVRVAKT